MFSEKRQDNGLPTGVYFKKSRDLYIAQLSYCSNGVRKSGHLGSSIDPNECFLMYKQAKEAKIKELAEKYKSQLDDRVYNSLTQFEVK